jgi:hypothetical protein
MAPCSSGVFERVHEVRETLLRPNFAVCQCESVPVLHIPVLVSGLLLTPLASCAIYGAKRKCSPLSEMRLAEREAEERSAGRSLLTSQWLVDAIWAGLGRLTRRISRLTASAGLYGGISWTRTEPMPRAAGHCGLDEQKGRLTSKLQRPLVCRS